MKFLQTIDQRILSYWATSPEERVFAYGVTFAPVVVILFEVIVWNIK